MSLGTGQLSCVPSLVAPGYLGRPIPTNLQWFYGDVKGASPLEPEIFQPLQQDQFYLEVN